MNADQTPATAAGAELHFYLLGYLSAVVPERDRRKALETVRRYILAIEAEARALDRDALADLSRALRRAVSNVPEAYGGFGLVRRVAVDDALVDVIQQALSLLAREAPAASPEDGGEH